MSLKVLILGINGFIGSSLLEHCLVKTDWQLIGFLNIHVSPLKKAT